MSDKLIRYHLGSASVCILLSQNGSRVYMHVILVPSSCRSVVISPRQNRLHCGQLCFSSKPEGWLTLVHILGYLHYQRDAMMQYSLLAPRPLRTASYYRYGSARWSPSPPMTHPAARTRRGSGPLSTHLSARKPATSLLMSPQPYSTRGISGSSLRLHPPTSNSNLDPGIFCPSPSGPQGTLLDEGLTSRLLCVSDLSCLSPDPSCSSGRPC